MEDQAFVFEESQSLRKNTFTRSGYEFAGWSATPDGQIEYLDESDGCKISSEEGATVVLYAVWKRLASESDVYWIAPASYYASGWNYYSNSYNKNSNRNGYINETTDVIKTQDDIRSDVAILRNPQDSRYSDVFAEYENFMKTDKYHLYTRIKNTNGEDADNFCEFRILEVGAHDDDGSVLTFQTIHALPEKYQMNEEATTTGSWEKTLLRTKMVEGGEVCELFNTGFVDDISATTKLTGKGGGLNELTSTADKLWIPSSAELISDHFSSTIGEGKQFQFYIDHGVRSGNHILLLMTMCNSRSVQKTYDYSDSDFSIAFWLRSPVGPNHSGTETNFCTSRAGQIGTSRPFSPANEFLSITPCFCF